MYQIRRPSWESSEGESFTKGRAGLSSIDNKLQPDGSIKRVQVCVKLEVPSGGEYKSERSVRHSLQKFWRRSTPVFSIHNRP
jgi:hypothetical protein